MNNGYLHVPQSPKRATLVVDPETINNCLHALMLMFSILWYGLLPHTSEPYNKTGYRHALTSLKYGIKGTFPTLYEILRIPARVVRPCWAKVEVALSQVLL